jgi:hypothetical protein
MLASVKPNEAFHPHPICFDRPVATAAKRRRSSRTSSNRAGRDAMNDDADSLAERHHRIHALAITIARDLN